MTIQTKVTAVIMPVTFLVISQIADGAEVSQAGAGKRWPVDGSISDVLGERNFDYVITQPYNRRSRFCDSNGNNCVWKHHDGLDIAYNGSSIEGCGDAIYPIAPGNVVDMRIGQINCDDVPVCSANDLDGEDTVDACNRKRRREQCGGGWGNYTRVHHPSLGQSGLYCLYAHFQDVNVSEEEAVSTQSPLGTMGNSGFSTGCHLHLRCSATDANGYGYYAGSLPREVRNPVDEITNGSIGASASFTPTNAHFCSNAAVGSGAPDYTFSCTRVTNVTQDGETPVIEEGGLLQLNAHYTDVHGSGVSLRVYVDRDGQRFTWSSWVGNDGREQVSELVHDEGPHNYTNDPHTAYVLPKIENAHRVPGVVSSIFRFYVCLDRVGEMTDYAACKAAPDFSPAPSITVVAAGAIPPQPTLVTQAITCPPPTATPGNPGYCTTLCPCNADEGVCTSDAQCSGSLTCDIIASGPTGSDEGVCRIATTPVSRPAGTGYSYATYPIVPCIDAPSIDRSSMMIGDYQCAQPRTYFVVGEQPSVTVQLTHINEPVRSELRVVCNGVQTMVHSGGWQSIPPGHYDLATMVATLPVLSAAGACDLQLFGESGTHGLIGPEVVKRFPVFASEPDTEITYPPELLESPGSCTLAQSLGEDFASYAQGQALDANVAVQWTGHWGFVVQDGRAWFPQGHRVNAFLINEISPQADGALEWYMFAGQASAVGGVSVSTDVQVNDMNVAFRPDWELAYYNGLVWVRLGEYFPGEWYKVRLEWRSSDRRWRMRVGNGAWSDWDRSISTSWSHVTAVSLNSNGVAHGGGRFGWDNLQLVCPERGSETPDAGITSADAGQSSDSSLTVLEDFEACTLGSLHTQAGWSGDPRFTVSTSGAHEGAKTVSLPNGIRPNVFVRKMLGQSLPDGSLVWHMLARQNTTIGGVQISSNVSTNEMNIMFRPGGIVAYYNGISWVSIGSYSASRWVKLEAQWRGSDSSFRIRIDDGQWSSWDHSINTWDTIESIALNGNGVAHGGGSFSWDLISLSAP